MAEEFGAVLRRLRLARGLTQVALGKAIGATQGYISQLEQGREEGVQPPVLARLVDALGDPLGELGAALPPDSLAGAIAAARLPYLGTVPAGPADGCEPAPPGEAVRLRDEFPAGSVALRVVGRSMEGRGVFDGDLAAVRRTSDPAEVRDGDIVVARVDGGYVLKAADVRGPADVRLYAVYAGGAARPVRPGADGIELFGVLVRVIGRRTVPPRRKK